MSNTAVLYRMHTDEHLCPFGLKTKSLLERKGYEVEDHELTTREQADSFKQEYKVDTTPQTFINSERIGGYEEVKAYFGQASNDSGETSYTPVIAIFTTSFLAAIAITLQSVGGVLSLQVIANFIALSMIVLAIQKLRDLSSFTNQFIGYDLLSRRYVPYAYVYPFAEAYAGIGMLAGLPGLMVAPVALFIGVVGAVSVFKAVYVEKRELKCACVGGSSNVPLGFVSLTENLFMIAAGVWMLS